MEPFLVKDGPVYQATPEDMQDLSSLLSKASAIANQYGAVRIDPPAGWPIPKLRMNPSSEFFVRSQDIPEAPFVDIENANAYQPQTQSHPKHEKRPVQRKRSIDDEDEDDDDDDDDEKNKKNNNSNIHIKDDDNNHSAPALNNSNRCDSANNLILPTFASSVPSATTKAVASTIEGHRNNYSNPNHNEQLRQLAPVQQAVGTVVPHATPNQTGQQQQHMPSDQPGENANVPLPNPAQNGQQRLLPSLQPASSTSALHSNPNHSGQKRHLSPIQLATGIAAPVQRAHSSQPPFLRSVPISKVRSATPVTTAVTTAPHLNQTPLAPATSASARRPPTDYMNDKGNTSENGNKASIPANTNAIQPPSNIRLEVTKVSPTATTFPPTPPLHQSVPTKSSPSDINNSTNDKDGNCSIPVSNAPPKPSPNIRPESVKAPTTTALFPPAPPFTEVLHSASNNNINHNNNFNTNTNSSNKIMVNNINSSNTNTSTQLSPSNPTSAQLQASLQAATIQAVASARDDEPNNHPNPIHNNQHHHLPSYQRVTSAVVPCTSSKHNGQHPQLTPVQPTMSTAPLVQRAHNSAPLLLRSAPANVVPHSNLKNSGQQMLLPTKQSATAVPVQRAHTSPLHPLRSRPLPLRSKPLPQFSITTPATATVTIAPLSKQPVPVTSASETPAPTASTPATFTHVASVPSASLSTAPAPAPTAPATTAPATTAPAATAHTAPSPASTASTAPAPAAPAPAAPSFTAPAAAAPVLAPATYAPAAPAPLPAAPTSATCASATCAPAAPVPAAPVPAAPSPAASGHAAPTPAAPSPAAPAPVTSLPSSIPAKSALATSLPSTSPLATYIPITCEPAGSAPVNDKHDENENAVINIAPGPSSKSRPEIIKVSPATMAFRPAPPLNQSTHVTSAPVDNKSNIKSNNNDSKGSILDPNTPLQPPSSIAEKTIEKINVDDDDDEVQVVNEKKCKRYTRATCLQESAEKMGLINSNSSGIPEKRDLKDDSNKPNEKKHETELILLEGDERRDTENAKDVSDHVIAESQEKDKASSRRKSKIRNASYPQDKQGKLTQPIVFPDSLTPITLANYKKQANRRFRRVHSMIPDNVFDSRDMKQLESEQELRDRINKFEESFWSAMKVGINGEKLSVQYGVDVEAKGAYDAVERAYVKVNERRNRNKKRKLEQQLQNTKPNNTVPKEEKEIATVDDEKQQFTSTNHKCITSICNHMNDVPDGVEEEEEVLDEGKEEEDIDDDDAVAITDDTLSSSRSKQTGKHISYNENADQKKRKQKSKKRLRRYSDETDDDGSDDINGEPESHVGNLNKNGLLRHLPVMPGINHTMFYVGQLFTRFCWHVEDAFLNSVSYLHHGSEEKVWYAIPPAMADNFEKYAKDQVFSNELIESEESGKVLLMNKTTIFDPREVKQKGIEIYRVIHKEGSFVLTAPRAYHAGFNCGYNVAEAVNFANPPWLRVGRQASQIGRSIRRGLCVPWECLVYHEAKTIFNKYQELQQAELRSSMGKHYNQQQQYNRTMERINKNVKCFYENETKDIILKNIGVVAEELKHIITEGEELIRIHARKLRVATIQDVPDLVTHNQLGSEFGHGAGIYCVECHHACHFYAEICSNCKGSAEARCIFHHGSKKKLCREANHKSMIVRRHDPLLLLDMLSVLEDIAGIKVGAEEKCARLKGFVRPWETPLLKASSGFRLKMSLICAASKGQEESLAEAAPPPPPPSQPRSKHRSRGYKYEDDEEEEEEEEGDKGYYNNNNNEKNQSSVSVIPPKRSQKKRTHHGQQQAHCYRNAGIKQEDDYEEVVRINSIKKGGGRDRRRQQHMLNEKDAMRRTTTPSLKRRSMESEKSMKKKKQRLDW